ncbi:MAG TPA: hypothetical protein VF038_09595, partial [Usitatibacter sp.]
MVVPVVRIGEMLVRMRERLVPVPMGMTHAGRDRFIVGVQMMRIVRVLVLVLDRLVEVAVLV